jgi:hypothetical protein
MAEVMKFQDFKEEGTENAVKVCVYLCEAERRYTASWV